MWNQFESLEYTLTLITIIHCKKHYNAYIISYPNRVPSESFCVLKLFQVCNFVEVHYNDKIANVLSTRLEILM